MRNVVWMMFIGLMVTGGIRTARSQTVPADCVACLRLDIALDKGIYEVGEPIVLAVRLSNIGSIPVAFLGSVDVTGRLDGYTFEVTDAQGRALPDPGAESIALLGSIGFTTSILPNSSSEREFILNYHVAPMVPGQYFVRGRFTGRPSGAQAESERLSFEISATTPAQLRQRVSELEGEMELEGSNVWQVAAFLGFTGDPSALPALVDLLYADDRTQVAAADALLFFDQRYVEETLFDALRSRRPRNRLVHLLVTSLMASRAEVKAVLMPWLDAADNEARAAAVEGLPLAPTTGSAAIRAAGRDAE